MALKDKIVTIADIRALGPCYDPGTVVSESWTSTIGGILAMPGVAIEDKLWVIIKLIPLPKIRSLLLLEMKRQFLADATLAGIKVKVQTYLDQNL